MEEYIVVDERIVINKWLVKDASDEYDAIQKYKDNLKRLHGVVNIDWCRPVAVIHKKSRKCIIGSIENVAEYLDDIDNAISVKSKGTEDD